jgi:hypothetical protein
MYGQILKNPAAQCLFLFVACLLVPLTAECEAPSSVSIASPVIQYEGRNAFGLLTGKGEDGFDQYVDQRLSVALNSEFPGMQSVLGKSVSFYTSPTVTAEIQNTQQQLTKLLIQVMSKSQNAPPDRKPILLLAAVRLAARLNTADLSDTAWQQYRPLLEKGGILFKSDPVKGPVIYDPGLHAIWHKYPETPWGQDAFVLDLKNAFGCEDGSQEYHVMIRLGSSYVRDHPNDPRNPWVNFVVALAFEDWYAVAQFAQIDQNIPMSHEDVDAGMSLAVRNSAVQYFLKTALGAPHTELATAAAAGIKGLSAGFPLDDIAFACFMH